MLSFSRLVTMRGHVLFIFLTVFGSLVNVPTAYDVSNARCKSFKGKSVISRIRNRILCNHDMWQRPDRGYNGTIVLYIIVTPYTANFDEDSSILNLKSRMHVSWRGNYLTWYAKHLSNVTQFKIPKPDVAVLSADNDDIYNHQLNRTTCDVLIYEGKVACSDHVHHKIRCQTDFTLWPYDHHKCTLVITSWSHTTKKLIFAEGNSPARINMSDLKPNLEWNISISRVSYVRRPSHYYYKNLYHPQLVIDFEIHRLHSNAKGRFAVSAVIMMCMTLSTLWLNPKSIERLAVSSLNIIIHMMCVRDLHRALPHSGTTIPNIQLFYISSFVLAIVAILLTYLLGKIEEIKISAPKWILSIADRILKSKAGRILMVCMLDSKAIVGSENGGDVDRGISDSELKKSDWKYVAIFLSWAAFFSFFFAYVLMYALLIPSNVYR